MRYQSLDMNLLAALEALLTERSVGGAAARMNMTQPGMSNALSRLREHFGDQLLVRVGNRMTMTPVAEALRPELQDILRRVRDFATPSQFDPAGTHRTIQILVEEYVPGWRLARFAAKLRETAPHLVLKIYTSRDDAADRLMRGDADLLIASPRVTVAGMPRLLLYEDGFTCVVGPHHPFRGERMDLETYLDQDHVKLFHGDGNKDLLGSIGIHRRVSATVPNVPMLLEFVRAGAAVATVLGGVLDGPDRACDLRRFQPPFELPSVEVFVQWHARAGADPLVRWLCDLLRETC
jgi:LysR family nod box-dependent transcriptional activator